MMPGGFGEMADSVDHHQRSLPGMGAKGAANPAFLVTPMRQIARESGDDVRLGVSGLIHIWCSLPRFRALIRSLRLLSRGPVWNMRHHEVA